MAIAGEIHLAHGTPDAWVGLGTGHLFFSQSDGGLYFRNSLTGAIVCVACGGAGVFLASAVGTWTVPSGVTVGDVVYSTGADTGDLATNTILSTVRGIVGVVTAKPTLTTATIAYAGELAFFAGLTPGATYYLGTLGSITTNPPGTPGSVIRRIGIAKNSTTLVINLGEPVELAT
jgi:hypothetical protein